MIEKYEDGLVLLTYLTILHRKARSGHVGWFCICNLLSRLPVPDVPDAREANHLSQMLHEFETRCDITSTNVLIYLCYDYFCFSFFYNSSQVKVPRSGLGTQANSLKRAELAHVYCCSFRNVGHWCRTRFYTAILLQMPLYDNLPLFTFNLIR